MLEKLLRYRNQKGQLVDRSLLKNTKLVVVKLIPRLENYTALIFNFNLSLVRKSKSMMLVRSSRRGPNSIFKSAADTIQNIENGMILVRSFCRLPQAAEKASREFIAQIEAEIAKQEVENQEPHLFTSFKAVIPTCLLKLGSKIQQLILNKWKPQVVDGEKTEDRNLQINKLIATKNSLVMLAQEIKNQAHLFIADYSVDLTVNFIVRQVVSLSTGALMLGGLVKTFNVGYRYLYSFSSASEMRSSELLFSNLLYLYQGVAMVIGVRNQFKKNNETGEKMREIIEATTRTFHECLEAD